jgi:hypothetical protein
LPVACQLSWRCSIRLWLMLLMRRSLMRRSPMSQRAVECSCMPAASGNPRTPM